MCYNNFAGDMFKITLRVRAVTGETDRTAE